MTKRWSPVTPLADDHSSESEDTATGVEESAAPAAPAALERAARSLLEKLQAIRIILAGSHQRESISLRSHENCGRGFQLGVTSVRVHVRVKWRRCRHLLVQKGLVFVVRCFCSSALRTFLL